MRVDRSSGCSVLATEVVHQRVSAFSHGCDTKYGSSGGAILRQDNEHVVGLHFARAPGTEPANFAIPITRILQDMEMTSPLARASISPSDIITE